MRVIFTSAGPTRARPSPFVVYVTGTDIADLLENALDHNALDQLDRELRPPLAQYEALRGHGQDVLLLRKLTSLSGR